MGPSLEVWSSALALSLALGSLLFYLSTALWTRLVSPDARDAPADFNLGLPASGDREALFAVSLVAAGTSLSTVFVFFLTAGSLYGAWLLTCPILFATGNYLMFAAYRRAVANGYFEPSASEGTAAGLVPYLGQRLTGSRAVGVALLAISVANLLAVFLVELIVAVDVLGYLIGSAFEAPMGSRTELAVFTAAIILLLGYVFVGGFRAVLVSDVWQMKAMQWAIVITLASLTWRAVAGPAPAADAGADWAPGQAALLTFLVGITLGNLCVPMSQESSWQRFLAFHLSENFRARRALQLSIVNAACLWLGLIAISFLLRAVVGAGVPLRAMSNVFDALRGLDAAWFPFCVFPILTVAALSAMFSTADTCVSALLYLVEYGRDTGAGGRTAARVTLPGCYYAAMAGILAVSVLAYGFVRVWFNPTVLQLIFSVFSNLVVITPTIATVALLKPLAAGERDGVRARAVLWSLGAGSLAYWSAALTAIAGGGALLWLSESAVLAGFVVAAVPLLPLWLRGASAHREDVYVLQP